MSSVLLSEVDARRPVSREPKDERPARKSAASKTLRLRTGVRAGILGKGPVPGKR